MCAVMPSSLFSELSACVSTSSLVNVVLYNAAQSRTIGAGSDELNASFADWTEEIDGVHEDMNLRYGSPNCVRGRGGGREISVV